MLLYSDFDIDLFISDIPHINFRFPLSLFPKTKNKKFKEKPFELAQDIQFTIVDLCGLEDYVIDIKKGFTWDGATIVKVLWSIVGSNTDNSFALASMVHDVICSKHSIVDYDRELSSKIFRGLLLASEVPEWKANLMYYVVDFYQKYFVDWSKTNECCDNIAN